MFNIRNLTNFTKERLECETIFKAQMTLTQLIAVPNVILHENPRQDESFNEEFLAKFRNYIYGDVQNHLCELEQILKYSRTLENHYNLVLTLEHIQKARQIMNS